MYFIVDLVLAGTKDLVAAFVFGLGALINIFYENIFNKSPSWPKPNAKIFQKPWKCVKKYHLLLPEIEENPLNIFTIFSSTALYYFIAYNLLWKAFSESTFAGNAEMKTAIAIVYTEILMRKVVLWCIFTSEKIHNSTFRVKISVQNVIFSNEMEK